MNRCLSALACVSLAAALSGCCSKRCDDGGASLPCVNLIENGSFELTSAGSPDVSGLSQTKWLPEIDGKPINPPGIPGGPGMRIQQNDSNPNWQYYPAPDGLRFAVLHWVEAVTDPDTHITYSGPATMSQAITTPLKAGHRYQLSFCQSAYKASDAHWGSNPGNVRVELAPTGSPSTLVFGADFYLAPGIRWTRQTVNIPVPSDGAYTIKFLGYQQPSTVTANVDNIVLCEQPSAPLCPHTK